VTLLLVAIGGGLGAAARFLVDTWVARHNRWATPLGTVIVNVSACLLLGLLVGWALGRDAASVVAVLGVGVLGGYSTFSTASVEAARLLLAGRSQVAVAHALVMLVLGFGAAVVGIAVGTRL